MSVIFKYLLKKWFTLLLLSEATCFTALQLWHKVPDDHIQREYRNMLIFLSMLAVLILCASALTIFLNLIKQVRSKSIYQLLTFFLAPIIIFILSVKPFSIGTYARLCTHAGIVIPFAIWLITTYILFSRWLKRNKNAAN